MRDLLLREKEILQPKRLQDDRGRNGAGRLKTYYLYMMTNKARTVLYVGITNGLTKRVVQHREKKAAGFTARYNCNRLVYFESFSDVGNAITREKEIKGWRREKKNALVESLNPTWDDLAVSILGIGSAPPIRWKEQKRFVIPSAARDLLLKGRGDPSTEAVSG
jgi:putative endonuclease